MSFRTPSTTQNRQTLLDLERTKARLALNQTRIATGKRLTRPGDDPTAAATILDLGNSMAANAQFLRQADSALGYLKSSEDAVSATVGINMRLQEIAANGANGGAAFVPELDALRSTLLSLANTQEQGKYLFAGTQTQTVPFVDGAPPAAPTYAGDSGTISLDVSASSSVAINMPGDQVFFGTGGAATNIFQAVADLRAGLVGNNAAQVKAAGDNLKTVLDNLNQVMADLGGRQAGVTALKDTLSGYNLTLQDLQNTQQDTDYPTAMTEYTADQTMQSATLSSLAKTTKSNLFDYLG